MSRDKQTGKFQRQYVLDPPNPSGLCLCGCGELTPVAKITQRNRGVMAGYPMKYIQGHFSRTPEAKSGYEARRKKGEPPNPSGLCQCGCGEPTSIADRTSRGNVIGHPKRFICGHHNKLQKKGADSPKWKGGRWKHKSGYIYVYTPEHPNATVDGYVPEHRLVMEKHIGRYLTDDEVAHHVNEEKDDNRIENLQLMTKAEHMAHHARTYTRTHEQSAAAGRKGAAARWGNQKD